MHLIINCPRNSKIASKLRQTKRFLSYDRNNISTVLIYIFKTARPTKIPMPFLSSSKNLLVIILRQSTKHVNCWQEVQYPLKACLFQTFANQKHHFQPGNLDSDKMKTPLAALGCKVKHVKNGFHNTVRPLCLIINKTIQSFIRNIYCSE